MKNLKLKTFTHQGDKNMHVQSTLQSKLLSKLAMTCLLVITASWLTFIGCAPETMDPVSKKAGGGTPTPDPVVDPPAPVVPSAYLAVGDGGKIALSTNFGSSWQAVDSGTTSDLHDIATDGNNFVAVASNGGIVRSTDQGKTWAVVPATSIENTIITTNSGVLTTNTTMGLTANDAAEIEYGNGVFALWTSSLTGLSTKGFYRSTDGGATWSGRVAIYTFVTPGGTTNTVLAGGSNHHGLVFAGGRFVASAGFTTAVAGFSTNGANYVRAAAFGTSRNFPIFLRIANGRFFFYTRYTTPIVAVSLPRLAYATTAGDWGATPWTTLGAGTTSILPASVSSVDFSDIAHSGSVYAFVGSGGAIMTTADADPMAGRFTAQTSPVSTGLNRLIFFNGKFVAAGDGGVILNGDTAGTTWTAATSGTTAKLVEGEAIDNKIIVFTGADGKLLVSSDGTTWEDKSVVGNSTKYNRLLLFE